MSRVSEKSTERVHHAREINGNFDWFVEWNNTQLIWVLFRLSEIPCLSIWWPRKPISSWIGLHFQQFVVIRCWSWAGQMNVINVGTDKAELQNQRSLVSPLNASCFLSTCFSRPHLFYLLGKHVTMYIEWETTHPQLLRISVFCFCVAYQPFRGTKEQRERESTFSLFILPVDWMQSARVYILHIAHSFH